MMMNVLIGSMFAAIIAGLVVAALAMRRYQNRLKAVHEATQLQRRGDHLFKIALAAQVHTRYNPIGLALLDEAVRVLNHSLQVDPHAETTKTTLRECYELIGNIETESSASATGEASDHLLVFPENELIEAQLHLTEASRLLSGLEKRGQIGFEALKDMNLALNHGQRTVELRLQLHRANSALSAGDAPVPKDGDNTAGEYMMAEQRPRVRSI